MVVKFYLPEGCQDEAVRLLGTADNGAVELLVPGTLFPEGYKTVPQQERRGLLDAEDAREAWENLLRAPVYTYAIEDLIE